MYRLVDCGTWDDPWFESLPPPAKLLFLYLITNPRSTSCGAFEITPRKMAFETGLEQRAIERWLTEWAPRVVWWPEHQIVFLKNFYRRQSNSEKVRVNAQRIVAAFPLDVRETICMTYPELCPAADAVSSAEDTLPIPYPYGSDKRNLTETEQIENGIETERARNGADAPPKPKAKRASAITETWEPDDALLAWARAEGFADDAIRVETVKFVNHFTANGKPMKDWRAAWRNWLLRARDYGARAYVQSAPNGHGGDEAMTAWLQVIRHKTEGNVFPVNIETGKTKIPSRILDAMLAVGGYEAIDPANNYQRKDFLAAYRATEEARHEAHR